GWTWARLAEKTKAVPSHRTPKICCGLLVKGNRMNPCRVLLLCGAVWGLAGAEARAHFLFIRIGPPAEAGRAAEVYFSDLAEAGDPRFVEKIADTRLWVQTAPGQFQPLKVHKGVDRLRAPIPVSGGLVVVGRCEYGVIGRHPEA